MEKYIILFLCIWNISTTFAQNIVNHVIQRGETLESIATRCGTSQAAIKALNPLVDVYCTGMEIVLPVQEQQTPTVEYSANTSVPKKKKSGNSFFRILGNAFVNALGTIGNSYAQYNNMYVPSSPTMPYYNPSMSMNNDWGTGFAGSMMYSNDPILNSTIGMAMSEQRLMNEGVVITGKPDFDRYKPTTSNNIDWNILPGSATLGNPTMKVCPYCNQAYMSGVSGHMCKK